MSSFPQPLLGVRVVDFSNYLPGPYCTSLLAAFGAEVIKIESPNGDPLRTLSPALFKQLNTDKASVCLDLATADERQKALELVRQSDLVVDGFKPDVAKKLGLDAETLRADNQALVVTSISGFGYSGPYAHHGAHDLTTLAVAGYFSLPSSMQGKPSRPHVRLADLQAGQMAAMASMMALQQAQQTGQGSHVDACMFDAVAHMALPMLLALPGQVPDKALTAANMPQVMADSEIYACSDGQYLAIATMEDKYWQNFAAAMADVEPDLSHPNYAQRKGRDAHKQGLYALLEATFAQQPRDFWLHKMAKVDTILTPVYLGRELFQDAHFQARQLTQPLQGEEVSLMPVRVNGQRNTISQSAPSLGADNKRLFAQ